MNLAEQRDHLPGLNGLWPWAKAIGMLALLVVINVVVFVSTWAFGIIVTLPLTIFLAFLLFRDLMPRNKLPRGRPPRGIEI